MGIRTTVTLDEDVKELVMCESRARGISFSQTLNDLIRKGLRQAESAPQRSSFQVKPTNMGYHPGLNYDDVESLIEYAEGDTHR